MTFTLRGAVVLMEKLIYFTHTYTRAYTKYQSRSQDFNTERAVLLFVLGNSPVHTLWTQAKTTLSLKKQISPVCELACWRSGWRLRAKSFIL